LVAHATPLAPIDIGANREQSDAISATIRRCDKARRRRWIGSLWVSERQELPSAVRDQRPVPHSGPRYALL